MIIASGYSLLQALTEHPEVSREEVLINQSRCLRRLVRHAYDNVAYYRQLFDKHGLKPRDIRGVEDLYLIPVTNRKTLQQLPFSEIVVRGVKPEHLVRKTTAGSTGRPLTVWRSWLEERILNMFRRRVMREYGLRSKDRIATVTSFININSNSNKFLDWFSQAANFYRNQRIDCNLPQATIVEQLCAIKPDVLLGPAGLLARLATHVGEKELRHIKPRFVSCGAEVLTPLMRAQIEAALNVPLYDMYGSHEFNLIAWECPETHEYHICDNSMIVEVLNNGRKVSVGERGEVIGTSLYAFTSPLIRYHLGDMVTYGQEQCRCGRPLATIKKIEGRMNDLFISQNGHPIYYSELNSILRRSVSWVRAYQMTQESLDRFVLNVEPARQPTETELAVVKSGFINLLGDETIIDINLVDELKFEKNGKFRVFRSLINSAYDEIDWED
jgi:phenylacetate-CoA ligase